jgi:hypothetical protein
MRRRTGLAVWGVAKEARSIIVRCEAWLSWCPVETGRFNHLRSNGALRWLCFFKWEARGCLSRFRCLDDSSHRIVRVADLQPDRAPLDKLPKSVSL